MISTVPVYINNVTAGYRDVGGRRLPAGVSPPFLPCRLGRGGKGAKRARLKVLRSALKIKPDPPAWLGRGCPGLWGGRAQLGEGADEGILSLIYKGFVSRKL